MTEKETAEKKETVVFIREGGMDTHSRAKAIDKTWLDLRWNG